MGVLATFSVEDGSFLSRLNWHFRLSYLLILIVFSVAMTQIDNVIQQLILPTSQSVSSTVIQATLLHISFV